MIRTNTTIITGPSGSGKKSIMYALMKATDNIPGLVFVSYNLRFALEGTKIVSVPPSAEPTSAITDLIEEYRGRHEEEPLRIIIAGEFDGRDIDDLAKNIFFLKIALIRTEPDQSIKGVLRRRRDGKHHLVSETEIENAWRKYQHTTLPSVGRASLNRQIIILENRSPFETKLREIVELIDFNHPVHQIVLDRLLEETDHEAYEFVRSVSDKDTSVRLPLVEVGSETSGFERVLSTPSTD